MLEEENACTFEFICLTYVSIYIVNIYLVEFAKVKI